MALHGEALHLLPPLVVSHTCKIKAGGGENFAIPENFCTAKAWLPYRRQTAAAVARHLNAYLVTGSQRIFVHPGVALGGTGRAEAEESAIGIHFVKIINTKTIFRTFILDNIMSSENPSNIFLYLHL